MALSIIVLLFKSKKNCPSTATRIRSDAEYGSVSTCEVTRLKVLVLAAGGVGEARHAPSGAGTCRVLASEVKLSCCYVLRTPYSLLPPPPTSLALSPSPTLFLSLLKQKDLRACRAPVRRGPSSRSLVGPFSPLGLWLLRLEPGGGGRQTRLYHLRYCTLYLYCVTVEGHHTPTAISVPPPSGI